MINIVLYEPEIPQNTGNIMRTCMAFNMRLHLIEPLGFSFDDKYLRRSHMDYIKEVDYRVYPDYEAFLQANPKGQFVYFTRYGLKGFEECVFAKDQDIYLLFGKESTGIPKEILQGHLDSAFRIPMRADARSLNLSNCVAIGAFECLRQVGFDGLSEVEVIKGANWLLR